MSRKRPKSFPQTARLKKPAEFRKVFNEGHKQVGRYFVVFYSSNLLSQPRLGLAVGRRAGNAVARNFLKRLIREKFRQNQYKIGSKDLVFIARNRATNTKNTFLNEDLGRLFRKVADD